MRAPAHTAAAPARRVTASLWTMAADAATAGVAKPRSAPPKAATREAFQARIARNRAAAPPATKSAEIHRAPVTNPVPATAATAFPPYPAAAK